MQIDLGTILTVISILVLVGSIIASHVKLNAKVKNTCKHGEETKKEINILKADKLSEKDHTVLCENSTLRFEKHVSKTFTDFNANIFQPAIQKLFDKIDEK
ncbi:hypothetical protein H8E88_19235 [candidate division KSB1 bacterium]|nr:hypothetical protein [candidate division KSB1 bacterium]